MQFILLLNIIGSSVNILLVVVVVVVVVVGAGIAMTLGLGCICLTSVATYSGQETTGPDSCQSPWSEEAELWLLQVVEAPLSTAASEASSI